MVNKLCIIISIIVAVVVTRLNIYFPYTTLRDF